MKRILLIVVAVLISIGGYAQSFTDGDTHFVLQYDVNATDAGCLTTFANTGGAAFAGGNIDYTGYSTCSGCSPSPDAIYVFGTEGSIDNVVSPYYFNVFYTGTACDEMDGFTSGTPKGIDLSVSKKVFVTAKANGNTTVEFFLANGVNNAFPGAAVGSGTWETFSYTVGDAPAIAMNLTTSYATYEIDFSGIAAFDTWAGRTKVNQWGIRMTQPSAEVWIKTIEFGVAPTSNVAPTVSITSPADAAEFDEGIDITIDADAADADGSVAKVEFYYGAVKIGEDVTSPYSITWSGAAAGTHSLTAVATDDLGATTTSTAVSVTVNTVAGITNSLKAKHISLYPNPSNGDVSIKTSGREGQIVITNTQGVVVETLQVSQQDVYQIHSLEKGIYVVKFTTAGNSTTERLIVQ